MKVCIYLRKSRSEENAPIEEVLNRHRATLLAYAKKHKLKVVEIKSEVQSGESIVRRQKMLELLQEVEENKYDAVLVMDIDRLGRGNMREQGLILETFKRHNTKIITPNKTYDLDNEFDEEYSEFEAFMSRRELKIIKKRLMRGRMKSLEEGNYIASIAPYGYEKKDKTLMINEKEAEVVKLIFHLYTKEGYGDSKIANYLIDHKIPTAKGNLNWDKTTIRSILKNPVYTGRVVWGKKKTSYDIRGYKQAKLQAKNKWLIYQGKHAAIIKDEVFKEAEEIAHKRISPRNHSNRNLRNPLAGLIKCGCCGSTMTIRTDKNKPDSLRCYRNCGGVKSSYIKLIEERLLEAILKELAKFKYSFKYQKETSKNAEIQVIEDHIEKIIKNRETLVDQKEKLYDLLEQGLYDNETFQERMKTINNRIDEGDKDIKNLQKKLSNKKSSKENKSYLISPIADSNEFIKELYPRLDAEKRNRFLKILIEKVVYDKDKTADKEGFNLEIHMWL
ncbi:recombinase family protein [Alkaliphilus serpentinus]|uniref:Recombinase family protein n=1 Tax=Alkaliphilus serpentinus TaxID=1482731 RepID=A0A833HLK0_9FIRM|nr:recombinase family protein [Alkaliphilus serpentinus]KAB3525829.1 recombinase family protein [Alkaliphilus serpentinus]